MRLCADIAIIIKAKAEAKRTSRAKVDPLKPAEIVIGIFGKTRVITIARYTIRINLRALAYSIRINNLSIQTVRFQSVRKLIARKNQEKNTNKDVTDKAPIFI